MLVKLQPLLVLRNYTAPVSNQLGLWSVRYRCLLDPHSSRVSYSIYLHDGSESCQLFSFQQIVLEDAYIYICICHLQAGLLWHFLIKNNLKDQFAASACADGIRNVLV